MIAAGALSLSFMAAAATSPIAWEKCTLETSGLGRTDAKCGAILVSSKDAKGAPVELRVAFALLEATGNKKQPDPIVLLPGGPGQAATELAAIAERTFHKALRDRDVFLFDPRGTGRSMKLSCANDTRTLAEELAATDEENARVLEECAKSLPLDPKEITTAHVARDLEAVREALGVATWNLVGISYGTRLALSYDRMFPGRARALVLDGVVPFSMRVGEEAAVDALEALKKLDARCRENAACNFTEGASFVDIVTALRTRLDQEPALVTIAHPTTNVPVTLKVDGKTAVGVVRLLIYAEETSAILPPILRAAHAGDLRPLAAQLALGEKMESTLSQPMQLSVLCSEDIAPTPSSPGEPRDGGPFPDFIHEMRKACRHWPRGDIDARFHDDAPASQTPALLLSGSADPVTPPRWGEAARATLPNSKHVIARGVGHNVIFRGCAPDLVARFLATARTSSTSSTASTASVAALDVSCADKLGPFPLFIDALGPSP